MEIFKFLGTVYEVSNNQITIVVNREMSDWNEAVGNLKIGDPINTVITKPQMEDWKKWLKKFNSIFTR